MMTAEKSLKLKPSTRMLRNRSAYSSALLKAGGVSGNETPAATAQAAVRADLIKVARRVLCSGGTVEECFGIIVEAARREFGCVVLVEQSLRLRIDGCVFAWPEEEAIGERHRLPSRV